MKTGAVLFLCLFGVGCASLTGPSNLVPVPAIQTHLLDASIAVFHASNSRDHQSVAKAQNAVDEFERIAKGNRITMLNQLLYFGRWNAKGEQQHWGAIFLFHYFGFTTKEIHRATDAYRPNMDREMKASVDGLLERSPKEKQLGKAMRKLLKRN